MLATDAVGPQARLPGEAQDALCSGRDAPGLRGAASLSAPKCSPQRAPLQWRFTGRRMRRVRAMAADLRGRSDFRDAKVDGADFTDALLDKLQQQVRAALSGRPRCFTPSHPGERTSDTLVLQAGICKPLSSVGSTTAQDSLAQPRLATDPLGAFGDYRSACPQHVSSHNAFSRPLPSSLDSGRKRDG